LVASNPEAIQVSTTLALAAVLQQTRTLPVIFAAVADPFGTGFVNNLARPGANVTGFVNDDASIAGKWMELLKEIAPHLRHVTVLYNSLTAAAQTAYYRAAIEAAATSYRMTMQWAPWQDQRQLEEAILALQLRPDGGLVVIPAPHLPTHRELIVSGTNAHRIPAVFSVSFLGTRGRTDFVWRRFFRSAPSRRRLRGPCPAGCEPRRSSGPASNQIRTCNKPEGRRRARA
jgi:putative tryptophan/tyrosine transport system substrate-binding protein